MKQLSHQFRMPHRTLPKALLIFCFMASILVVPLIQLRSELVAGKPIQELDIFQQSPTIKNLRNYEDALADQSVVAKRVRIEYQQWLTSLLSRGNEKVVPGREGWLFYRPSLDYITSPTLLSSPLAAITAFQRTPDAQGVELLILPMPGKATIYPEHLSSRYDPAWGPATHRQAAQFFADLRARGIHIFDPTDLLWNAKEQALLYIPQETHWSPHGVELVAQALADEIRSQGWLTEGPQEMFSAEPRSVVRQGDIYDMLQLPDRPNPDYPPLTVEIARVLEQESGEPITPDENSPIVLLGDSFTNIFSRDEMGWGNHAGFAEHLALELGTRLDVIALNGGGTTKTREELARRPSGLRGKKLVIWQFATRDLTSPDSEWKIVDMAAPSFEAVPAPARLVISGEVLLPSLVPDPLQVPYTECLTYIKYQVLSVQTGSYGAQEVLCVLWGMQNAEWMPAARFQEGQRHLLTLEPLDDHTELDHIMRADDTDDYTLTPYWVSEWSELGH